jgi:hypothetical protein
VNFWLVFGVPMGGFEEDSGGVTAGRCRRKRDLPRLLLEASWRLLTDRHAPWSGESVVVATGAGYPRREVGKIDGWRLGDSEALLEHLKGLADPMWHNAKLADRLSRQTEF